MSRNASHRRRLDTEEMVALLRASTVAFIREQSAAEMASSQMQQDSSETISQYTAPYCTGWYVSPTQIVSAYHCFKGRSILRIGPMIFIRPGAEPQIGQRALFVVYGQQRQVDDSVEGTPRIVSIVRLNKETDLAILQLVSGPPSRHFLYLSNQLPNIGDPVFLMGHPSGLSYTYLRGMVSRVSTTERLDSNGAIGFIQSTAHASPGCSGGPLVNRYGEVVGVADFYVDQMPHLGIFTLVQHVRTLLGR